MSEPGYAAAHVAPIWIDRSDLFVYAAIPDSDRIEQLAARTVRPGVVELCCIPFYQYDMALGDNLEVDDSGLVTRVADRSGRLVLRAYFGDDMDRRGPVELMMREAGCLIEWTSGGKMMAIDAKDWDLGASMVGLLTDEAERHAVVFETGWT